MGSEQKGRRFHFIDGLRGLAALAVVLYHFVELCPSWLQPVARHGDLGVAVFFVISGFVIAYSIRGAELTRGYVGRFALRRACRLDPAYWTVIALTLLSGWILVPSTTAIAANLLYLQDLAGQKAIVNVSWTLCLEVQLYLTFVILSSLGQRWGQRAGVALFAGLALLAIAANLLPLPLPAGLFVPYWPMFFLGALAWLSRSGVCRGRWFWLAWLAFLPIGTAFSITAAATAAAVYLLGLDRLQSWLSWAWLQALGKWSYGIYLLHILIGKGLLYQLQEAPVAPWAKLLIIVAASVFGGYALHVAVERPGMQLYDRLSRLTLPLSPFRGRPASVRL